jgi:hypothetical protein
MTNHKLLGRLAIMALLLGYIAVAQAQESGTAMIVVFRAQVV